MDSIRMSIRSSPLSQFALSLERARIHRLTIDFGEKEVSISEGIGAGNRVGYDDGMPYPAMYAFEELVAIVLDGINGNPRKSNSGEREKTNGG